MVFEMAFRARNVSGTFEKRAPGPVHTQFTTESYFIINRGEAERSGTLPNPAVRHCIGHMGKLPPNRFVRIAC